MAKIEIIHKDFRNCDIPKGLTITDPPYNQGYAYNHYKDRMSESEYINLLSKIPTPCVIIHYPEETINLLPKALSYDHFVDVYDRKCKEYGYDYLENKIKCEQVVAWVYNSNTGKQHRLISWWGCKPNFNNIRQPYKNPTDKRIKERIANGKTGAKLYDWWDINQVKNVSKEKTEHPCQIPEEVIRRIILTTAKPGDVIIDVFAGSGTTNKIALDLGFDTIAYEIDESYVEIIKKRTNFV
jgi:DNA modification methylase